MTLTVGELRAALIGVPDRLKVTAQVSFTRDVAEDEGLADGPITEMRVYTDGVILIGSEDADVAEEPG